MPIYYILKLAILLSQGEMCTGTEFAAPGDKWLGGDSPYLHRPILPTDDGVAHRTYPLGAEVLIVNMANGKTTVSTVIDRGPFGREDDNGKFYNGVEVFREARRAGEPIPAEGWRGCVDMTPFVTNKIGMRGKAPVYVRLQVQD